MKTLNRHILVGLIALIVTGLASCIKEQPSLTNTPEETPQQLVLSIGNSMETFLYYDYPNEIPFTVTQAGTGKLVLNNHITHSTKVSMKTEGNSGIITLTPYETEGSVLMFISNGKTQTEVKITFDTYVLEAQDLPDSFGDGSEYTFSFDITTNLPDKEIIITSDDWIRTEYQGGKITATIARNSTNDYRTGSISVTESKGLLGTITVPVTQDYVLTAVPGMVEFKDRAFRNAMIEIADTDGDREISFEEALAVKEINITGKGVSDLTGLEAFKNVWKFDAQDNDIKDATVLRELHYLYWLDLKGNKGLQTFDVTSCTAYFEHCEFEVTDDLLYYVTSHQMGVEDESDMYCFHSKHILDDRQTSDWSNQDEMRLIRRHTRGDGYPIVFTGRDWIDIDIQDGTADRLANNYIDFVISKTECFIDVFDLLDFYILYHKAENRLKFAEDWSHYFPSVEGPYPGWEEISKAFWADQSASFPTCYEKLFGRNLDDTYRLIVINLNLGGAPNGAITWCSHLGNYGPDRDTIFPGWDWGNTEYGFFLGYQTMTVFQERTYTDGAPEKAYYVPFYYGAGGTMFRATLNQQYPPHITTDPRAYHEAFDKLREKYQNN